MKKFLFILIVPILFGFTWTNSITTNMTSTTIGAGSSSSVTLPLGSIAITGTVGSDELTVTVTSTAQLYAGLYDSNWPSTIESVDSATQFTLDSEVTAGSTDFNFASLYTVNHISVKVVGEADATTATVNFYQSSDAGTTWATTPFYTETITGLAAATKTIAYRAYQNSYPWIKVEVVNNAPETGATDDIAASVFFAGGQ